MKTNVIWIDAEDAGRRQLRVYGREPRLISLFIYTLAAAGAIAALIIWLWPTP